jgi:hypothetical protein
LLVKKHLVDRLFVNIDRFRHHLKTPQFTLPKTPFKISVVVAGFLTGQQQPTFAALQNIGKEGS